MFDTQLSAHCLDLGENFIPKPMVWGLFTVDPLSGGDKYYIFAKGTYKVGRRGCDVTISNDKGVSRVHAEIDVDTMVSLYPVKNKTSDIGTKVCIRDLSKYGTFITRADGSKDIVHECSGKETVLRDGDLVSFGPGNAKYRFSFVPFIFYYCNSGSSQVSSSIEERVLSIGGYVTRKWAAKCTHVMVEEFSLFSDDMVGAVVSKKPFILPKWLEILADSTICNEIPSCSGHVPTLTLEGTSVVAADIRSRENCLKDYSFLLESAHLYKYGGRLSSMLEVSGATARTVEAFDSVCEGTQVTEGKRRVYVIPARSTSQPCRRDSLIQINEMDLIRAVISGYLDSSMLISPSIAISSSCSTDETIVADSDAETDTGTTPGQENGKVEVHDSNVKYEGQVEISSDPTKKFETVNNKLEENEGTGIRQKEDDEHAEFGSKVETSVGQRQDQATSFVDRNKREMVRGKMDDGSESGNSEILYSQALIVRNSSSMRPPSFIHPDDGEVVNYKRFRKAAGQSAISFSNFVPFAKYPYMESENESMEVVKYVEEEKKRKEMEAIAEELFNSEKGKRRGVAGSIHSLLTHRH